MAHSLSTGNIRTNSVLCGYKDIFGYKFLSMFYKTFCNIPLCLHAFQEGNLGISNFQLLCTLLEHREGSSSFWNPSFWMPGALFRYLYQQTTAHTRSTESCLASLHTNNMCLLEKTWQIRVIFPPYPFLFFSFPLFFLLLFFLLLLLVFLKQGLICNLGWPKSHNIPG